MTSPVAMSGKPASIGAKVPRLVDDRMLRGHGRYVDDINLPGMVHAHILRSTEAHARISSFDASEALAHPEVLDVIGPSDVRDMAMPCIWQQPGQLITSYPIATDNPHYVGQPIGLVVGSSRAYAEDGESLIDIRYEALPPVVEIAESLRGDVLLRPELGTNVVCDFAMGVPFDAMDAAISHAAHVATCRFTLHRHSAHPMECRGIVASWDDFKGQLTVWLSTQVPHHSRELLAQLLGLRLEQVRLVAPDVGGAFGSKDHLYPDEVLAAMAALRLHRPVKWIEDRSEHFVSTLHGRDDEAEATLAADETGRFLVLKVDVVGNVGAHTANVGLGPTMLTASYSEGPYRFDLAGGRVRACITNRTPTASLRGFGGPEAAFIRERLIDELCREGGLDPIETRRQNLIRAEEMPYKNHYWLPYDSGDYVRAFDRAVELLKDSPPPRDDGKVRGQAVIPFIECTGVGPTWFLKMGNYRAAGYEAAVVEMEGDGSVKLRLGVATQGQGHETSFAQIAADALGVEVADVRVIQGDTEECAGHAGTMGSRSLTLAGAATSRASTRLRAKLIAIAAHQLEAAAHDLELAEGRIQVRGVPTLFRTVAQVAESALLGWNLPKDVPPGALFERDVYDPPELTFSYATHGFQIAVDPELGTIDVERVVVVHDCGTVVNPLIVEGQVHGAIAQGIGEALLEEMIYDETGRPITTTFMDYVMPANQNVPDIEFEHFETPSPHVPGGFKGMGEGGTIAAPAAIASALAACFPEISPYLTSTALGPHHVWELFERARREGAASEQKG